MKNVVEPIKNKRQLQAVENYLKKRNKRNYLIFIFGINSGLRIGDILNLNIKDVEKNYVEVIEKKTGKYKRFPLNQKLKNIIGEYLKTERQKTYAINKDEPLFVGKKHYRLDRSQVYRFLNHACADLGININVGTHTMRKTFGYFFYKKYNDIALLQKIFNHSSPCITLRYIGIDQDIIDISYKNFVL